MQINPLQNFIEDFAKAIKYVDNNDKPKKKNFHPGIGTFPEHEQVELVMRHLSKTMPEYKDYSPQESYPNEKRKKLDLLLPGKWAIEFKWNSLYYDNGKELGIEPLSKTICYPFLKNNSNSVSLVGDCIKLMRSKFNVRKAVILITYEKNQMPRDFDIEIMIEQFEFVIPKIMNNQLEIGKRCYVKKTGLIHPVHQLVKLYGWEVLFR